jgi:cysteine desulfurase/selenocysteine lyase
MGIFPELDDFFQQIHASEPGFKPSPAHTARADVKTAEIRALRPVPCCSNLPRRLSLNSCFQSMLPLELLFSDFLILDQPINGQPLVYLDNAATTQKPMPVLLASRHYYEAMNSNIHRGTHHLARLATDTFEKARQTVATHLNAASPDEVIFTSGTTCGINLVANILGLSGKIGSGDEILISALEHHSNIVPWQMLCQRTGASLKVIPCHDDGTLDQDAFQSLLASGKVKVLALTWISNAFGTVNPVTEMTRAAKDAGALVLIDAAQAIAHLPVDVQALGADFLAFSGHKIYAPTGIGVLWGRLELLHELPPWQGGGEMIKEVTFEATTYNDPPFKYEAGTPNIEGAIALAAAFDYVNDIGIDAIHEHEGELIRAAADALADIEGIRFYGPADRSGSLSFNIEGVHHYDLGTLLDQMGVAVRTGHHCCQPLMARFGITGTVRASFALYNTQKDVEALAAATKKAVNMLR